MEKLDALINLERFEIGYEAEAKGHHLHRSWFVNLVEAGGKISLRPCATACNDNEHELFTAAYTIKRISICLLLVVSVAKRLKKHSRDMI